MRRRCTLHVGPATTELGRSAWWFEGQRDSPLLVRHAWDTRVERLADLQPVQCEERDQRVVTCSAGLNEEAAELVAIEPEGAGFETSPLSASSHERTRTERAEAPNGRLLGWTAPAVVGWAPARTPARRASGDTERQ